MNNSMQNINVNDVSSVNGDSSNTNDAVISTYRGPQLSQLIAIVGMGCRWPGSVSNASQLWTLLKEERRGYREFPKDRFNVDGYYHPNDQRPGSLNTRGAFLLDEDPRLLDHAFFNLSPAEALSMDPAQRKMLEVVYEAFENAGEPWHSFYGSNTGVFIGNFTHDHEVMQRYEPDFPLPYVVSGGTATMLSNRIHYTFDLKGPSMTLDTACSASLSALHLGVNAIHNGDCDAAVIAGSSLIWTVETQLQMIKLGILSSTSTCHSFDAAADGYARGDGFCAIYIRRVFDALQSQQPIRAIVRGTSINANGRSPGLTHPAAAGQVAAIRRAYRIAGLSPEQTGYVECHGTGTPVGDPIEISAVAEAFTTQARSEPLLVGTVKTNLGHSEAVSGLAGLMKTILALEEGFIPATIGIERLNPKIDFVGLNVKVVTSLEPWPGSKLRRASVNSFGYGGANAHCVLEHPSILFSEMVRSAIQRPIQGNPGEESALNARHYHNNDASKEPHNALIILSAQDEEVLPRYAKLVGDALERHPVTDVAYTMSRRSRFRCRTYLIANSLSTGCTLAEPMQASSTCDPSSEPNVAFVFTGQGADWPGMGASLMKIDAFRDIIEYLQQVLDHLTFRPMWKIGDILKDIDGSHSNEAEIAQTVCTALQIGLVALLKSWSVVPHTVIGHSSGEIAAAFCSSKISMAQAIVTAYTRGKAVASNRLQGLMMVVGLSEADCLEQLKGHEEHIKIAALNSPGSITLSGDRESIIQLREVLDHKGVFTRTLSTANQAYHSHHMKEPGKLYEALLRQSREELQSLKILEPLNETTQIVCPWISTVSPKEKPRSAVLEVEYWRKNLESPVRFSEAVSDVLDPTMRGADVVVEIGPQAGLRSPLKRIFDHLLKRRGYQPPEYFTALDRTTDGIRSLLKLGGNLFKVNVAVDVPSMNRDICTRETKHVAPRFCVDLPTYPWKYGKPLYHQSRMSRELQQRRFLRHDLLGAMVPGLSTTQFVWRNILRIKDVPWLQDHALTSKTTFPASGYIAMAIEASTQLQILSDLPRAEKLTLRQVKISKALQIKHKDVEIQLRMTDSSQPSWKHFVISAADVESNIWIEHCSGLIKLFASYRSNVQLLSGPRDPRSISSKGWYEAFKANGLEYGPSFGRLESIKSDPRQPVASAKIPLETTAHLFKGAESSYVIHPASFDMGLQLCIIAMHQGQVQRMERAYVPVEFGEIDVYDCNARSERIVFGVAKGRRRGLRGAYGQVQMSWGDGNLLMTAKLVRCVSYADAKSSSSPPRQQTQFPYSVITWKPDIMRMSKDQAHAVFPPTVSESEIRSRYEEFHRAARLMARGIGRASKDVDSTESGSEPEMVCNLDSVDRQATRMIEEDSSLVSSSSKTTEMLAGETRRSSGLESIKSIHESVQKISPDSIAAMDNTAMEEHGLRASAESLRFSGAYSQLEHLIDLLAHARPRMKIIEVGAGTWAATDRVMGVLNSNGIKRYHGYTYTDSSGDTVAKASENLGGFRAMTFKTLDIYKDPAAQGLAEGFDLVIASHFVHSGAASEVRVRNLRALLKLGGKAVIFGTASSDLYCMPSPQTWAVSPSEISLSGEREWDRTLRANGFTGVDMYLLDYPAPYSLTPVMLTTVALRGKNQSRIDVEDHVAVIEYQDTEGVAASIVESLISRGLRAEVIPFANVKDAWSKRAIFLMTSGDEDLAEMSGERFEMFQSIVRSFSSIVWLTAGGVMTGSRPAASVLGGLIRVLHTEVATSRYLWLDIEPSEIENCALPDIVGELEVALSSAQVNEREYAFSKGQLYSTRLLPVVETKMDADAEKRALHEREAFCVEFQKPGVFSSIYFLSDESVTEPLPEDWIQIEVRATGLNWKDLAVAAGNFDIDTFSSDVSGIVTQRGRKVRDLEIGDAVHGYGPGRFGNYARGHCGLFSKIPSDMSFDQAATITTVYMTAVYAFKHLARLESGEKVLIQSASGGLGLAALSIAKLAGAEIYVTVGSSEKKEFLNATLGVDSKRVFSSREDSAIADLMAETDGKGFDVILNTSTGNTMLETWRCIAPGGRFIDVGRVSVQQGSSLPMEVFQRNAIFASFDLYSLYNSNPELAFRMNQEVRELLDRRLIAPIAPVRTYSISKVDQALLSLSKGNHVGKIVLCYKDHQETIQLSRSRSNPGVRFDADAAYVVAGGFGGLGRSVMRWMVDRGARTLIVLSRSSTQGYEVQAFISSLRARKVEVRAVQCNIAIKDAVQREMASLCQRFRIRGILHVAVALKDALFGSSVAEQWNKSLSAKVLGTLNLHEATKDLPLDFFIMTTSIQTLIAQAAQSSYCAANSFQDSFARYRRSLGLPARTISLGLITEVNGLGQTDATLHSMSRNRVYLTGEYDFLQLMEKAFAPEGLLNVPTDEFLGANIVTCLDPVMLAEQEAQARLESSDSMEPRWRSDPKFAITLQVMEDCLSERHAPRSTADGAGESSSAIVQKLLGSGKRAEAIEFVVRKIIAKVADLMFIPQNHIIPSQSALDYGVDSLIRVELQNWFLQVFSCESEFVDLLQTGISFNELAVRIVAQRVV